MINSLTPPLSIQNAYHRAPDHARAVRLGPGGAGHRSRRTRGSRRWWPCRTGSATELPLQPEEGREPGQRQPGPAAVPGRGQGWSRRLLRAVRVGVRGDGPHARHPGSGRDRVPRAQARSATTSSSTAPTTCTPGPRCTSAAPAGCGSSRRRDSVPAASPTTPRRRSPAVATRARTRALAADRTPSDATTAASKRPNDVQPTSTRPRRARTCPGPRSWSASGSWSSSAASRWCLAPYAAAGGAAASRAARSRPGPSYATPRIDLGVGWPSNRSPHETGYLLAAWFGPEPDGARLVRPPRGRGLAPGAEDALDRIVLTARAGPLRPSPPTTSRARWPKTCVPASPRSSTAARAARCDGRAGFPGRCSAGDGGRPCAELDREPEAVAAGGVIDHVG